MYDVRVNQYLFYEFNIPLLSLFIFFTASVGIGIAATIFNNTSVALSSRMTLLLLIVLSNSFSFLNIFINEQSPLYEERFYYSSLQMCIGPLLYFYVLNVTSEHFRVRIKTLVHFLPAPLLMLVWWLQLNNPSMDAISICLQFDGACDPILESRTGHRWLAYLSVIIYSLLSIRKLKQNQNELKQYFSDDAYLQFHWLLMFSYIFLGLPLMALLHELIAAFYYSVRLPIPPIFAIGPTVLIIVFAWFSTTRNKLSAVHIGNRTADLESPVVTNESNSSANHKPVKYKTSSLTPELSSQLWQEISEHVESEKMYLQPGLKVVDIANALGKPLHHISEALNGHAGLSFYDLINRYRVEEAALLLREHPSRSVTDIGYEVGFNSPSAFFSHFKKRYAKTPKQYCQEHVH